MTLSRPVPRLREEPGVESQQSVMGDVRNSTLISILTFKIVSIPVVQELDHHNFTVFHHHLQYHSL